MNRARSSLEDAEEELWLELGLETLRCSMRDEDLLQERGELHGFRPLTPPADCRIWSDGRRTAFVYHGTQEVNIYGGR